jgi:hypothetical protein
MSEFLVRKTNLPEFRVAESEQPSLEDGQLLVKVDRFAFTSNNITYGVAGDMLGYWQFFPPADGSASEWGILPMWLKADVPKLQWGNGSMAISHRPAIL